MHVLEENVAGNTWLYEYILTQPSTLDSPPLNQPRHGIAVLYLGIKHFCLLCFPSTSLMTLMRPLKYKEKFHYPPSRIIVSIY